MDPKLKECIEAVSRVVTEEGIAVYFQPLISLESRNVVGFEAFSRGVDREGRTVAGPGYLFNDLLPLAAQQRVENLCLKKSLESFLPINERYPEMLLFLNVNSSAYGAEEVTPSTLITDFDLNPRIIVFEFDVSQLKKSAPAKLIRELSAQGFRISLDNVDGSLQSRELLLRLQPDFAKLGRSYYEGVDSSKHKFDQARGAALILRETGAIAIAKGVETEAEALALAQAGIVLQQGYLYSDSRSEDGEQESFQDKVSRINGFYRSFRARNIRGSQEKFRDFHQVLKGAMTRLQQEDSGGTNWMLDDLARKTPGLVSAFVLNGAGKQISKRVLGQEADFIGRYIEPSSEGSDHSHEDYYMYLNSGFEKVAGCRSISAYSREPVRYLAGFFYQGGRRGAILVVEYVDKLR
ncbi:EAL domain-containing protein [Maridesulfovibrio sp.]|uniref:EAL domain-containing protein n=1 Tax=Maridesulfovibrio sp. TaxID=2795000 RepID=UPI002A189EED|nr:EAL domain-containing protein [Maridesulfovibrio sp.]